MEGEQGCEVRYYREGDDEQLVRLLQTVYVTWPPEPSAAEPIEHLRWKLRSHPEALRWHVVAEAGGELVGSRLFWVQRVRAGGRQLLARQGIDIAVHPQHQGQGIMSAMRNFTREVSLNAFDVELYLGSSRSHPALVRMVARGGEPPSLGNKVAVLGRRLQRQETSPALGDALSLRDAARFDERVDALWERVSPGFDYATVRDRSYLNWRYADAPGRPYLIRLAEEDGRLAGYAVLRLAGERAYVADLPALPARNDVAAALAADAIAHARRAGAERVECWLPTRHVYRATLEALGLKQRRVRKALAFRPLRTPLEGLTALLDPDAAIHVTMGDTDLV